MKLLKILRGAFCITYISILLIVINIVQLASLLLLPLNRRWFMLYNMGCQHFFCATAIHATRLCGNRITTSGDVLRQENALLFSNHQTAVDIVLIWTLSLESKTSSWVRWFAKDVLKYVPGVGWGLMFTNTVFLKRNWAKDANSIAATFARLRNGKVPTWLMIFPEGTRATPEKLAKSQAFAASKRLPHLEHVLVPRSKGIHSSLQGLQGSLSAVYDLTIQFNGKIPTALEYFTVGNFVSHVHIRRYDIKDVPTRERDLNTWLVNVFFEKDLRMIENLSGATAQPSV
jgi:1-acyl-sn-glycerol-3-phosphate acyltransferase